ncbi:MAG: hypothetical protein ACYDGR_01920 [Candidatus Dormibacteria bacterium]
MALGLAAVLSAGERTLLIDLNLDRADIASLLDIGEARTIYHLAFNAQLTPVDAQDLEDHLTWHEGLAILPGIARKAHRHAIADHFINSLIAQAQRQFDHVVVDLGRVRPEFPSAIEEGALLWVVTPGPLGVGSVETATIDLAEEEATWPKTARAVLNRTGDQSFLGVDRFLEREYGLPVVGQVPDVPAYMKTVELSHSVRALSVPGADDRLHVKRYGSEALAMRRALEALRAVLTNEGSEAEVASGS